MMTHVSIGPSRGLLDTCAGQERLRHDLDRGSLTRGEPEVSQDRPKTAVTQRLCRLGSPVCSVRSLRS